MELHIIETGKFKLDGGAMFGVVPKVLWQKTNPADNNNLCTWAMRCLLIEHGNQLVLIDTGMGDKQSDKFFSYYYPHGDESLLSSIEEKGFSPNDITDVFLTHLHFDHCGGAVFRDNGKLKTTFPNAKYWSHSEHWEWALNPNARERASFLEENLLPIQEAGQLYFYDKNSESELPFFDVNYFDGHTEKQMIPTIEYKGQKIVFMADLLPSVGHIPLPYVMGYDVRPLVTLNEKEKFLKEAYKENFVLFLEHDSNNICCTLRETERGIRLDKTFELKDL